MRILRGGLDRLATVIELVVAAALAVDLALTLAAMLLRYIFSISIFWIADLQPVLFNVLVFLGAGCCLPSQS